MIIELLGQEVVTAIFIVAITCIAMLFLKWRASVSSGNTILLLGLSGSGKTTLMSQILKKNAVYSSLSMITNVADYTFEQGKKLEVVRLCDLPGPSRLRTICMDFYVPTARGVIFVVDSANLKVNLKPVAGLLFELLTNSSILRNRVPVLVACNKQDVKDAVCSDLVREALENELNILLNVLHDVNPKQNVNESEASEARNVRGAEELAKLTKKLFGNQQRVSFDSVNLVKVRFVDCVGGIGGQLQDSTGQIDAVLNWISSL